MGPLFSDLSDIHLFIANMRNNNFTHPFQLPTMNTEQVIAFVCQNVPIGIEGLAALQQCNRRLYCDLIERFRVLYKKIKPVSWPVIFNDPSKYKKACRMIELNQDRLSGKLIREPTGSVQHVPKDLRTCTFKVGNELFTSAQKMHQRLLQLKGEDAHLWRQREVQLLERILLVAVLSDTSPVVRLTFEGKSYSKNLGVNVITKDFLSSNPLIRTTSSFSEMFPLNGMFPPVIS